VIALAALLREDPAASRWSRIHTRQAFTFGLTATVGYLVLLALPMLVVIGDAGISTGTTFCRTLRFRTPPVPPAGSSSRSRSFRRSPTGSSKRTKRLGTGAVKLEALARGSRFHGA
jgi:hypothetical protein